MSSYTVEANFVNSLISRKRMSSFSVLMCIFIVVWGNSSFAPICKNKGFYCNDTSINKTYHGDSISVGPLFLSLLGGAYFVTFLTELLSFDRLSHVAGGRFPSRQFSVGIKTYYAGFAHVLGFTEVLKLLVSELRPHFLHSCQPDFNHVDCSVGLVTEYQCTGSGPKWLVERDIYKSFPSGHASLSCFTFIFLSMYVLKRPLRVPWIISSFWKCLVVTVFLVWASVCCVSRAMDHRHFWWDIMAGIFIGVIGGLIKINLLMSGHIFKHSFEKST